MAKLFGTDGIRGIVGEGLTKELAYRIGETAGHFLATNKEKARIVIGRDTRGHGKMLEDAVVAGLNAVGVDALVCDVIPTPAIAYLVRDLKADGGVVISASHNPPEYNGIKLLNRVGSKLSDDLESEIEEAVLDGKNHFDRANGKDVGNITKVGDANEKYIAHSIGTITGDLSGLKIAVDCGHGAAFRTTPEALKRLGAEVVTINTDFDGTDINVDCGSTNLEAVAKLVRSTGADLGIAHDGDADRVLAVDESGEVIDGDMIMAICADSLKKAGKLTNNTVVTTVMANLGFDKAMERIGVKVVKTKVGDRYVLEQMRATGAVFGGEQSGHIIFLDHNSTGDGLVTTLQLVAAVKKSGKKLSELAKIMARYPQVLINVPVKDKSGLDASKNIRMEIETVERELADTGRVLVRPSGTESLVRVMVEAENEKTAQQAANRLVEVVKTELG